MRICHITTFWPNRFGHTHYTDALIKGIRAVDPTEHLVAAELPSLAAHTESYRCVPCWHRHDDYVADITRTVRRFDADVAILQYTNDLFGEDNRLAHLLESLEESGVRTVVNTHSVYPPGRPTKYRPGRNAESFDRAMAETASSIQVHSTRMKTDLIARGIAADKVCVIPHGSLLRLPPDRAVSRLQLGIPPEAKVILFFGFIWLGKGLDFLIDVFSKVVERVPDAFLYIGGFTRAKNRISRFYMNCLSARIETLGLTDRCKQWGDYVPDEVVPVMYGATDVVALPYRQDYSSVSGVVHQAVGMNRVMVCSRIAKFDEVEESISPQLVVDQFDRSAWVETLVRSLEDVAFHSEMLERVRQFAVRTSWEQTGKMHLDLYRRLLDGQSVRSAENAGR